jgi:uncharacterized OB-fold protein
MPVSATLIERPIRTSARSSLNYCAECGHLSEETLQACAECGGEDFHRVAREGAIYSYTTVRQSGGSFVLALVQLTEGPLVMGRVIGVDRELKVGLAVQFLSLAQPGVSFGPRGAGDVYF